jgi:hypothetical protein
MSWIPFHTRFWKYSLRENIHFSLPFSQKTLEIFFSRDTCISLFIPFHRRHWKYSFREILAFLSSFHFIQDFGNILCDRIWIPFSQKILEIFFQREYGFHFHRRHWKYSFREIVRSFSSSIQETEIGSRDWTLGPKDPGL